MRKLHAHDCYYSICLYQLILPHCDCSYHYHHNYNLLSLPLLGLREYGSALPSLQPSICFSCGSKGVQTVLPFQTDHMASSDDDTDNNAQAPPEADEEAEITEIAKRIDAKEFPEVTPCQEEDNTEVQEWITQ